MTENEHEEIMIIMGYVMSLESQMETAYANAHADPHQALQKIVNLEIMLQAYRGAIKNRGGLSRRNY